MRLVPVTFAFATTLLLAACGPETSEPIAIESLAVSETAGSVLVWRVELRTPIESSVTATVDDGDDDWTFEHGVIPRTDHELYLTGLRAETDYDVTVSAMTAAGGSATETVSFTTAALPPTLPPMSVDVPRPAQMAEGFTLFNVFRWPAGENAPDDDVSWLLTVDAAGELVWYATLDHRTDDAQLRKNGNLIYVRPHRQIIELDRAGKTVQRWVATGLGAGVPDGAVGVDVDTFHHEVEVLPNGHLLTLSTELREISTEQCPNYEVSSGDSLNVVGDVIVEFEPSTGEVVQSISTFDALDPCRRTDRGFEAGFWNAAYGGTTTQDWTHGNAVFYDKRRHLAVVSLRHQDWIVAYRYTPGEPAESGEVAWVLGEPTVDEGYLGYPGFEPLGDPFAWQYHQHAPMFTDGGTLLVYDNGNLRPGTDFDRADADGPDDRPFTRAVEYRLNHVEGSVDLVWEWRNATGHYAPFVGDADQLGNGNILVTDGGILDPPSNAVRSPEHQKLAQITEVTHRTPSDVVLQITVADPDAEVGYTVYRAERVTGFPR